MEKENLRTEVTEPQTNEGIAANGTAFQDTIKVADATLETLNKSSAKAVDLKNPSNIVKGLEALGITMPFYIAIVDPSDNYTVSSSFFEDLTSLEEKLKAFSVKYFFKVSVNPIKQSIFQQFGWKEFHKVSHDIHHALPSKFVEKINKLCIDFRAVQYPAFKLGHNFESDFDDIKTKLIQNYGFPKPIVLNYCYGRKLIFDIDLPCIPESTKLLEEFIKVFKKKYKLDGIEIGSDYSPVVQCVELPGLIPIGLGCSYDSNNDLVTVEKPSKVEVLEPAVIKSFINKQKCLACAEFSKHKLASKATDSPVVSDWLEKFFATLSPFKNPEDDQIYVDIPNFKGEQIRPISVESAAFSNQLLQELRRDYGRKLKAEKANSLIEAKIDEVILDASADAPEEALHHRLAYKKGCIYYDLLDTDGNIFSISKDGVNLLNSGIDEIREFHFTGTKKMLPQVFPTGNSTKTVFELLRPFLNMDDDYAVLVTITLITWFAKGANYFMCVTGKEGTGKTQLTRFISELIDPTSTKPGLLPKTERNLASVLASHYYVAFDNLTKITEPVSNMLCTAIYGASYEGRKLYTTDETNTTNFHNVVSFTAIDDALIEKTDLMQRTLTIKVNEFKGTQESEKKLNADFQKARPEILAKIFQTLSGALQILPDVREPKGFRLVDSAHLGCAISRVLFGSEEVYIQAFNRNKQEAYCNIVENDVVTKSILEWLRNKEKEAKENTVTGTNLAFPLNLPQIGSELFYQEVVDLAKERGVDITKKGKAPNATAMTKRRNNYALAFKEIGVSFENVHTNDSNVIDITINKSLFPTSTPNADTVTEEVLPEETSPAA